MINFGFHVTSNFKIYSNAFFSYFFNVKQNSRMRHKEVHLVKQVLPKHWRSHWRCSVRKGVLRNFAKFLGKHLCQSLFFNKAAGFRPATLLKKRLWCRCLPVKFTKLLRYLFLQNTSDGYFCELYKPQKERTNKTSNRPY